jgi:hypothetical protein
MPFSGIMNVDWTFKDEAHIVPNERNRNDRPLSVLSILPNKFFLSMLIYAYTLSGFIKG